MLRHLILEVISHASEQTNSLGRTLLQKSSYFLMEMLDLEGGYDAYYYGPYSERVNEVLRDLVDIGFVEEKEEFYPGWRGDIRKGYVEVLARDGVEALREYREEDETYAIKIQQALRVMHKQSDIVSSTRLLSYAAKVHYIVVHEFEESVTEAQIRLRAESLGWDIDAHQIDRAVEFLCELNLVQDSQD